MSEKIEWDLTKNVDPSEKHKVCTVSMISNPQKKFFIIAKKGDNELLCNHIHEEKELWNHLQNKEVNVGLCPICNNIGMKKPINNISIVLPDNKSKWNQITYEQWKKLSLFDKSFRYIHENMWWIDESGEDVIKKYVNFYLNRTYTGSNLAEMFQKLDKMIFFRPSSPTIKSFDINIIKIIIPPFPLRRQMDLFGYEIDMIWGLLSEDPKKKTVTLTQIDPLLSLKTLKIYEVNDYFKDTSNYIVIGPKSAFMEEYAEPHLTTEENPPPYSIIVRP
jgi:hypothetical protein